MKTIKRLFIQGIIFTSLLGFAIPAWSYTIGGGATDVGGLDIIIDSKTLANSGDATELAWAQGIIGGSVTLGAKYNTTGGEWSLTNQAGIYAHTLNYSPKYFLIKTGNVADPDIRWFLFQNNAELSYVVISLAGMNFNDITNVSGISHIDEFNGVPIPSAVLLFGSGLVGLVGIGRWRSRGRPVPRSRPQQLRRRAVHWDPPMPRSARTGY